MGATGHFYVPGEGPISFIDAEYRDALVGTELDIRARARRLREAGCVDSSAFVERLHDALVGVQPMDHVAIMASMAATIERLERRVVQLERASLPNDSRLP